MKKTEAKAVDEGVPLTVAPDLSPERARGLERQVTVGEIVLFSIHQGVSRPLLVSETRGGAWVAGTVFFLPGDDNYSWPLTHFRQKLSAFDCARLISAEKGDDPGQWRFR